MLLDQLYLVGQVGMVGRKDGGGDLPRHLGRILSSGGGATGRFAQPLPRLGSVTPEEVAPRHALPALGLDLVEANHRGVTSQDSELPIPEEELSWLPFKAQRQMGFAPEPSS